MSKSKRPRNRPKNKTKNPLYIDVKNGKVSNRLVEDLMVMSFGAAAGEMFRPIIKKYLKDVKDKDLGQVAI